MVSCHNKKWYPLKEAAKHYRISLSTMERWVKVYPSLFVVETRGRARYINIEESEMPVSSRTRGRAVPEGYLTFQDAYRYYGINRNTLHAWVRVGHMFQVRYGPRVYIDPARSNAPRGPKGTEIWRRASVKGYRVSNMGRIMDPKGNLLPEGVTEHGIQVGPGQRARLVVHREVARAFLAGFQEDDDVEHQNGDTTDNRAKNLRMTVGQWKNRVRVRVTRPDGSSKVYHSIIAAARGTGMLRSSVWYAVHFHTRLGGMTWERV